MHYAGRLFLLFALAGSVVLGSLGCPGEGDKLLGLSLARATSSLKKLEKKLKKRAKKTKKVLKTAEKKAGRVGKPVLRGALKVGAVLAAAAAAGALGGEPELSGGEEDAEADSPPPADCARKRESIRSLSPRAPNHSPPPPALAVHSIHRVAPPRP